MDDAERKEFIKKVKEDLASLKKENEVLKTENAALSQRVTDLETKTKEDDDDF
jgi:cell division protein FtsB